MYTSVEKVFSEGMPNRFSSLLAKGKKKTYQFNITDVGQWYLSIDDGDFKIFKGAVENPDCTLIMYANDFLDVVNGALGNQMAFMTGKLSITGDLVSALELSHFFPPDKE